MLMSTYTSWFHLAQTDGQLLSVGPSKGQRLAAAATAAAFQGSLRRPIAIAGAIIGNLFNTLDANYFKIEISSNHTHWQL